MANDNLSITLEQLFKAAQSSLPNFVSEITIKQPEISQASQSYQFIKQILKTKSGEGKIPDLSGEPFLTGSYARKTKITPLNDIDIFLKLNGANTTISGQTLTFTDGAPLSDYSQDGWTVSSVLVLNSVKKALGETYQSQITRDQQAVSVFLDSYGLTIDIVPAIGIKQSPQYIIPYGKGNHGWKYSNPKKDEEIVELLDAYHNKVVKPAIKIAKYWNREKNRNKLRSYHVEAIAYLIFSQLQFQMTTIQQACRLYFANMSQYITNCPDPTGLSEPVSSYLSLDLLESINLYTRIGEAKKAADGTTLDLIAYLKS
jgi:hypothetical protein